MQGDPRSVSTFEIKPRTFFFVLAFLGCIAFVLTGLAMLLAPGLGLPERAAGLLSIAFFGFCSIFYAKRVRNRMSMTLTREGFWWGGPTFKPKLIRWSDIEDISLTRMSGQKFNAISLRSTASLVSQFDGEEARDTTNLMRTILRFAGVALPVAMANMQFDNVGQIAGMALSGKADNLTEMFGYMRDAFGGEVQLSWIDRDRGPEEFQQLLRAWQSTYA